MRRDIFEVIRPEKGQSIQICPFEIQGHLIDGMYKGKPHIIVDGILSRVINKKGNAYKVINHGRENESWVFKRGNNYAHGKTLKDAKEALTYKISDRDTSKYAHLNLNSILTREEAIACYITITGACPSGTKYFVDGLERVKDEYSVKEIIEITKEQYGNQEFSNFFIKIT